MDVLRYFRSKIPTSAHESKAKDASDYFQCREITHHGFPSKASCLAFDQELNLLAIGTSEGYVKIYGAPGVEFIGKRKNQNQPVTELFFLPNQGRIISLCSDYTFHLWQIGEKNGHPSLNHVKEVATEGRLKPISCCRLRGGTSGEYHLLIGTEGGNIYQLDTNSFELTDHIIYQDVVIQNIPDDYKLNPGAVEALAVHPTDLNKLLIGYNRGLIVLWDASLNSAAQTYACNQQVESICWHRSGQKFVSSHNDGSYVIWTTMDSSKPDVAPNTPFGPFPCKPIEQILWKTTKTPDDEIFIFTGGMPRSTFGDRHAVSVTQREKQVVFDLSSKVLDILVLDTFASDSDTEDPHALLILCEEELVAIDLLSEDWPSWRLPYLHSIHASAITAAFHCSDVAPVVFEKLTKYGQIQAYGRAPVSEREWPINGGKCDSPSYQSYDLLLTGHEDGSVKFWDCRGSSLDLVYTLHAACLFEGFVDPHEPLEEEDWPAFRRVGVFDPLFDDARFVVSRIHMDAQKGVLVVGGSAGHMTIWTVGDEEKEMQPVSTALDLVADESNFVWKGQYALDLKPEPINFCPGLQPTNIVLINPPASCTALTYDAKLELLAIGTAHGYGVFDCVQNKSIFTKSTLSMNDVIARESVLSEGQMSRLKSFKKSLRESFRRRRPQRPLSPSMNENSNPQPNQPSTSQVDDSPSKKAAAPSPARSVAARVESPLDSVKAIERVVEARKDAPDVLNSMVRVVYFANTFLINATTSNNVLFIGTNAGNVLMLKLIVPEGTSRATDVCTVELVKEIQLRHRAPIMSIAVLDYRGFPLDLQPPARDGLTGVAVSGQQSTGHLLHHDHRLVICSEEQLKTFHLPALKPGRQKFKLTAVDGSRVRKVQFVNYQNKNDETRWDCFVEIMTNQGEIQIFNVQNLRRYLHHQCIRRDDLNGINSTVLTRKGEGFHLRQSSEFQRFSLGARHFSGPSCRVPLSDGVTETGISTAERTISPISVENRDMETTSPEPLNLTANSGNISVDLHNESLASNALTPDVTFDSIRDFTNGETHETQRTAEGGTVTITTKRINVSIENGQSTSTEHSFVHSAGPSGLTNGHGNTIVSGQGLEMSANDRMNEKLRTLNVNQQPGAAGDTATPTQL